MNTNSVSNRNKTVDIFYDTNRLGQRGLNGGFHVREEGKFPIMGDCHYKKPEDVLETAQSFLDKGYSIENIRINGEPIVDKFKRNSDGKYEPVVRHQGDAFEKKPSTMKKVGTAAASVAIPGAGQIINGEYKKAGLMVVGNMLLPNGSFLKDALRAYSAYDAYKNTGKNSQPQKTENVAKTGCKEAG